MGGVVNLYSVHASLDTNIDIDYIVICKATMNTFVFMTLGEGGRGGGMSHPKLIYIMGEWRSGISSTNV